MIGNESPTNLTSKGVAGFMKPTTADNTYTGKGGNDK